MRPDVWAPLYEAILRDFGWPRQADEDARDLAARLVEDKRPIDLEALRQQIAGREAYVAGAAATPLDLARIPEDAPYFLTDGAAGALFPWRRPTALVTDLDGDIEAQLIGSALGVPTFVHAHGDNTTALRQHLPRFEGPVQATTQADARGPVAAYGGFTDGDRAACIAVELGATSIALVGFDFDTPVPKPGADAGAKRRKLAWARRILDATGAPVRRA